MDKSVPARILFSLSSMETHVDMFEPIVNRLRQRLPMIRCDVVSSADFNLNRITDRDKLNKIFDHVWLLHDYDRNPVYRLIQQMYRISGRGTRYFHRVRAFLVRNFIHRILNTPGLQGAVFANDRAFPVLDTIAMAKQAGLPTLLVQESIRKDEIFPRQNGVVMHGQGGCDRIAAWGETSRDYFIRAGVVPHQVVITGNPRIDSFATACHQLSKGDLRVRFGIPPEVRLIILATNPVYKMGMLTRQQYLESIWAVVSAVREAGENIRLIVKPHLIERPHHLEWGLDQELKKQPNVIYGREINLPEAIVMADGVLIFNSTVAVEAALMQKDVGVLNLFHVDLGFDFAEYDLAVDLNTEADIQEFVTGQRTEKRPLSRNGLTKIVENVGDAADIIASEIIELAAI